MEYQTIVVKEISQAVMVSFHRPHRRNSINAQCVAELQQVLTHSESNPACRVIILQGENGIFCTGMDFQEIAKDELPQELFSDQNFSNAYMELIKNFTSSSKIIISLLDGQVLAGGVGIVAASDIVISTQNTNFGLSETLWGLLPACVMPFLIRRIGFQKAYYMTLMAQTMQAQEAYKIGLIDELTDNLLDSFRRNMLRINRISEETVGDLKSYFRKMWIITEEMENTAVQEIARLMEKTKVQNNIRNFVEQKKFPWETI